jgi:hypothetical protein
LEFQKKIISLFGGKRKKRLLGVLLLRLLCLFVVKTRPIRILIG